MGLAVTGEERAGRREPEYASGEGVSYNQGQVTSACSLPTAHCSVCRANRPPVLCLPLCTGKVTHISRSFDRSDD